MRKLWLKKAFKKVWTFLKEYWYIPLSLAIVIFLLLIRQLTWSKIKWLWLLKRESTGFKLEEIEKEYKEEKERLERIESKYDKTLKEIENKYDKKEGDLRRKEKKKIKEFIESYNEDSEEVIESVAEKYGWEYEKYID